MPLYENVGGTIKRLNVYSENVGGTIKTLKKTHENVGGSLKLIHNQKTMPTKLTWTRGVENDSRVYFEDQGNGDGMTNIYIEVNSTTDALSYIQSNLFEVEVDVVVTINCLSYTGGSSFTYRTIIIYDESGNELHNDDYLGANTYTFPSNGKYSIKLTGYGITGGQQSSYYPLKANYQIAFS